MYPCNIYLYVLFFFMVNKEEILGFFFLCTQGNISVTPGFGHHHNLLGGNIETFTHTQHYCQSIILRQISDMSCNLVTGRPSTYYTVPNKPLLSGKIGVSEHNA